MIGVHESYSPFDPGTIFQEDGPDATVKNRFLNRCFIYILYECCIADPHSCLSWIWSQSTDDADIRRVIERTIPAYEGTSQMIAFFGPELAALVAAAVMNAPWPLNTFHGLKNCPPYMEWYARHLKYFGRYRREAIADKIHVLMKGSSPSSPTPSSGRGLRVVASPRGPSLLRRQGLSRPTMMTAPCLRDCK